MISDRLIVEERHFAIAKEIQSSIEDRNIVLIYGSSGTGKSEVADCLQEELFSRKLSSLVLSLDDFYTTMPSLRNTNRKKMGIETVGLQEIDWQYLVRICQDFKDKKPIYFRRVHKYADLIEHNSIDSDDVSILIIEGLYSAYLKTYNYGDFSVYLEGNPKQTLAFRKKRRKENPEDDFRKTVINREFNIVCQLKKYSELIIPFLKYYEN